MNSSVRNGNGCIIHNVQPVYEVAEKEHGKARSGHWATFKKDYELKVPKVCRGCGATEKDCVIELHHIRPFHSHPEDELKEDNVVWLCEGPNECHRLIGHSTNFRGINPHVLGDADSFNQRIAEMHKRLESEHAS